MPDYRYIVEEVLADPCAATPADVVRAMEQATPFDRLTINAALLACTGSGVTDHGALTGLGDDDHLQYHTDARGDLRYSLLGHTHAYQPVDAGLTSFALLGTVADRMVYTTGVDTWAESPITAYGRTLNNSATAAAALTTLGITGMTAAPGPINSILLDNGGGGLATATDFTFAGGLLTIPVAGAYKFTGRGGLFATADGAFSLRNNAGVGGTITGLTGLAIRDTSAAFDVTLAATSTAALTAGRSLTLDLNDASSTLKFAAASIITFPSGTETLAKLSVNTFTGAQTYSVAVAASTPVNQLTGGLYTGGTGTTTLPVIFHQPTGTTAGTTWSSGANRGTIFGANEASGYLGNFVDFRIAGVSKFEINNEGGFVAAGDFWQKSASIYFKFIGADILYNPGFLCGIAGLGICANTGSVPDVLLVRGAADQLAQRRGTNPQNYQLFGTYTDASNYERLTIRGQAAAAFQILTEKAGTGVARALEFGTDGTARWSIDATGGHLLAVVDATYDIGASGANRPRHLFCTGNLTLGGSILCGNVQISAPSAFYWTSRSIIRSPSDGSISFLNNAETAFGSLLLGPSGTTYNRIKHNAAGVLELRLADDSAQATWDALAYRVAGTKVVGAQGAAVADAAATAGTATVAGVGFLTVGEFNTFVAATNAIKDQLNLLLARTRASTGHGLIA